MSTTPAICSTQAEVATRFSATRRRTLMLTDPLTPEDMMVQSSPEASPAKWHLAHTAWFFESFVLREYLPGYQLFNPDFQWLFNSYYQTFAAFPEKRLRASFSRPPLAEILKYRAYIDQAVDQLLTQNPAPEALQAIELGVNHEEQHQELLLTDILHAFFTNPLRPPYLATPLNQAANHKPAAKNHKSALAFQQSPGGLFPIGHDGKTFCFDNELDRHQVYLQPFAFARRLVTCKEYAEFIADNGYLRPELWLSDGWSAIQAHGWRAPLYWTTESGEWSVFTLRGAKPLHELESTPVSHISYFEADAYARWAGRRLPTEFEWETVAANRPVAGNLLDSGNFLPLPASGLDQNQSPGQLYGDCWEWTVSAYLPYPGFKALPGSLGEYNGKFMSGQMILRGGSCLTPAKHIRATYRNFFPPDTRWQFSGIRLAS
jgi:ergothioneine biosynthesis protein EgtB